MKKIPGFRNYFASNDGRIYKQVSGHYRPLTIFLQPYSKYMTVYLTDGKYSKIMMYVHNLIAMAYLNKSYKKYTIIHKDKNVFNNGVKNLRAKKGVKEKSEDLGLGRKIAIKDYERRLLNYIGFKKENPFWKKYEKVKLKGNDRLTYNFLYLFCNANSK